MKKIFAFIIALMFFLSSVPVSADENSSIFFEKAVKFLETNNRELKSLTKVERKTFSEYQIALGSSANLDTNGITVDINGTKTFREFTPYLKMLMVKKKELLPELTKFIWETAANNLEMKNRSLAYGLRGLYLELEKTFLNLEIKNKSFNMEVQKSQLAKRKLDKGLLSSADFEEAEYNLTAAEKEYETAKRNLDNSCRSFNLYMGVSLNTRYDDVDCELTVEGLGLYSLNDCIHEALKNRLEILSLNAQIKLKELEMDIIKRNDLNKIYTNLIEDYDNGLKEIEELKVKLDKVKYDIEYEIRNNYTDLIKSNNVLKNSYNSLKTNRLELSKMQSKYKQSLITKLDIDEAEINQLIAENQYKIDVFNYNTKVKKFKNAISLGPIY